MQEGGQARPAPVEAVDYGQMPGGIRDPDGVGVAFIRKPGAGEIVGGAQEAWVLFHTFFHPVDCRIPGCKKIPDRQRKERNIESAEIITIGTEMLLGALVDTNTAWISTHLAELGVGIYRHTTVGDNPDRIVGALKEAATRSDLVITTGGLGPTSDDLTNECLARFSGREMVEYERARRHVDDMFDRFGRKPTPSNYKQALFPEGTTLIPNPLGTAMGALLEVDDTLFATFPGVPVEMKGMFSDTLAPLVRERSDGSIVTKTLWFAGMGESALAERVQDLLDAEDPTVAPASRTGEGTAPHNQPGRHPQTGRGGR